MVFVPGVVARLWMVDEDVFDRVAEELAYRVEERVVANLGESGCGLREQIVDQPRRSTARADKDGDVRLGGQRPVRTDRDAAAGLVRFRDFSARPDVKELLGGDVAGSGVC